MPLYLGSEAETRAFAARLARMLRPPLTIGLSGPLGAGKTTLVRELAGALGLADPVSSPTYVLQHEYGRKGELRLEHWDLYRLTELPDDLLEPPAADTIRLIEWPERAPEMREELSLIIRLEWSGEQGGEGRKVSFEGGLAALFESGWEG